LRKRFRVNSRRIRLQDPGPSLLRAQPGRLRIWQQREAIQREYVLSDAMIRTGSKRHGTSVAAWMPAQALNDGTQARSGSRSELRARLAGGSLCRRKKSRG